MSSLTLNAKEIKKDFPIFDRKINGKELVYLDNAATSQKPKIVISAMFDYYSNHNANVHRGIHTLAEEATEMYENAREKVAKFFNARFTEEIIFTKGTTGSLNSVVFSYGLSTIKKDDIILLTEMEHHSNLVPWQELIKMMGAKLEYIEVDKNGEVNFEDFERKFSEFKNKIKIVAVTHASNVLGTIVDIKNISKLAHQNNAVVVVDGAQAAPHMQVDVQSLGCDFYALSAHKMLGPTGLGVLYIKKEIQKNLEPDQFGGGMIDEVGLYSSTWAPAPEKFEAGTPNISGAVGFGAAIDYLNQIGIEKIQQHEKEITKYAIQELSKISGLKMYGPPNSDQRVGLVSFTIDGLHPHDIAAVLNNEGVAVRSGHHCTQPLHKKINVGATVRASFYFYNDTTDVDILVEALKKAQTILG